MTSAEAGNIILTISVIHDPHANGLVQAAEDLDDALAELARQRRSTKSKLAREGLEVFARGKKRASVTALAGCLVGSLEGPADLSADRRHMRGYGK